MLNAWARSHLGHGLMLPIGKSDCLSMARPVAPCLFFLIICDFFLSHSLVLVELVSVIIAKMSVTLSQCLSSPALEVTFPCPRA